jgi:Protein of unknown function (DUF499)
MMLNKTAFKPWHQVVRLRDELRTGELSLSIFAADLYDVVMEKARPVYQEPDQFFSFTYPTFNLRELAKDVALRLAGKNDKAVRQLELTYGGGKTHTLITLYHLSKDPASLPALPAVREFVEHIGQTPPKARIAVLAFDKLDVEKGMEITAPTGEPPRWLRNPWSVLAYQLAGSDGLRLLHSDGLNAERESAPAENLLVELLSMPARQGLAPLILIDEVLMYVRGKVGLFPEWRGRLVDFFQYLTQAATKIPSCAIVASLLATDPTRSDALGRELSNELAAIFRREHEGVVHPVLKEDVAEVLRRRFFEPASIADSSAFRASILPAVQGIADLDEQTRRDRKGAEERFLKSYPFHPDLTEVLYSKWTQLDSFQRTRGILRTFALALRDVERWDQSPLVGANAFLGRPGAVALSEAARELTNVAMTEEYEGKKQEWTGIMEGELARAREIQAEFPVLHAREIEQAVFATFLHSQPIGQKAQLRDLSLLLGQTQPDKIALDKALRRWAEISWFLDEAMTQEVEASPTGGVPLPRAWRLGSRPNLSQMHHEACEHVLPEIIEGKLEKAIEECKPLSAGASAAGATPHVLPDKPADLRDTGEFHYAVLEPKAASRPGKPSELARRFLTENTGPDYPRVYRNAVVLAVPSEEGIAAAREAIRKYQGWNDVEDSLRGQDIDSSRKELLALRKKEAAKLVTEMVRQAYNIVVTISDKNEVQAFKVVLRDDSPLFNVIKADKQSRIIETAVTADALLPGGPYDLWREGDTEHLVSDLASAFAHYHQLPKVLNRRAIFDTLLDGCRQGLFVLRSDRGDGSSKTFWFDAPPLDNLTSKDFSFSVVLSRHALLASLPSRLLAPGTLPELWHGPELPLRDLYAYFSGEEVVKRGEFDILDIPQAGRAAIDEAVGVAVKERRLWLISGRASLLAEDVSPEFLVEDAVLQSPLDSIPAKNIMPTNLPEAWSGQEETTGAAISDALSIQAGKPLPWIIVREAISNAINARWLERSLDSGPVQCDYTGAPALKLSVRSEQREQPAGPKEFADGSFQYTQVSSPSPSPARPGVLTADAALSSNELQDLIDALPDILKAAANINASATFRLRVELTPASQPSPDEVESLNKLLQETSPKLKLTSQ